MKRCELAGERLSRAKREFVRTLRRAATHEEQVLWAALRGRQRGPKWRRSHPILGWIVDLYCPEHRLVVEVDGGVHDEQIEEDARRDEVMRRAGLTVLRFRNEEVLRDLGDVLARIERHLAVREAAR